MTPITAITWRLNVRTHDRWAYCKQCGARLSYQVGSIMWQCRDDDVCISCSAKASAEKMMGDLRESLGLKRELSKETRAAIKQSRELAAQRAGEGK